MTTSFDNIWLIDGSEPAQEVLLDDWRCFEVQLPGLPGRTRHLLGVNVHEHYWEISSAISKIALSGRVCEMVSGQVYTIGNCNRNRNGYGISEEYAWWRWVHRNNARDIVDVTAEVCDSFGGPHEGNLKLDALS